MKLFLSSTAVPGTLREELSKLVGKPCTEITVALFENAADPYPQERRGFVARNYADLTEAELNITRFDLRELSGPETITGTLSPYDVIWFGGGNTFYLRWLMRESGFDEAVVNLLAAGKVYAGGSAGAIVAGPILSHFDAVDDPNMAPETIWEGLGLIDFVPLPHWNTPKYQPKLERLRENLIPHGKDLAIITDKQAIVVDGANWKIAPSA